MARRLPLSADIRFMDAVARFVAAVFVLVLVVAGFWWVLHRPMFALKDIRVDGEILHSNTATLRANVLPHLRGNFFTMDLARASAAFEAVPWVHTAVVRREWPDRLRVTLTEYKPVARWGNEESVINGRLLDGQGLVFWCNPADVQANEGLPQLIGPDERAPQVLGMYQRLEPLFKHEGLSIDQLKLGTRGSWQVMLGSGAVIELGRGPDDEVAAGVKRFLSSVGQVVSHYKRTLDEVEGVDLRHKDAYVLRLHGVSTVDDGAQLPNP
ncbi:MAG: FtsQ-type POTRA domain-containing protein [Burkholderiaceae bacterium]|jgi:cell division protein FtsQ|nr:FtsQ-type POTRA domain-containing protein [Burkholderiaceae bacterium]